MSDAAASLESVEILPAISDLGFQIIVAVVFVIPGLNTTWLIERLVGRTTPSGLERLLRAVSWSVLVYLLLSPWLLALASSHVSHALRAVDTIAFAAAALFAAPAVLGLLVASARRRDRVRGWLGSWTSIHPAPTAWDYAFSTPKSRYVRFDSTVVRTLVACSVPRRSPRRIRSRRISSSSRRGDSTENVRSSSRSRSARESSYATKPSRS
jgi:hypothetical protein